MVRLEGCKAKHDSGKALLVTVPDLDDELWIPHSQIEDDSEVYQKGDEGTLIITDWLAGKLGIL